MNRLTGKSVLVASGPTIAPIDAVRSIINRSSGRLGSVMACHLALEGAQVTQLAGAGSLTAVDFWPDWHSLIAVEHFETLYEFKNQLHGHIKRHRPHAVIMAAAVLDYLPAEPIQSKRASSEVEWTLTLRRGEKIIEQIKTWLPETLLIGFKLEAQLSLDELQTRAETLIQRSQADIVVANRVEDIAANRHIAYIIESDDSGRSRLSEALPSRKQIALGVCDALVRRLKGE